MKFQLLTNTAVAFLLPVAFSLPAMAQQVIGAKSGVIHYVEGDVFAADQKVETKLGAKFNELKENQVLRAEEGRAEILLNPGVMLRVAEGSSVRMINNKLTDTRLELLSGSTLIEVSEISDGNAMTLQHKDHEISFRKTSLVRVDADPAMVKVYQGEASVMYKGQMLVVKSGKTLSLDGSLQTARFDVKDGDAFYRWGSRRASYVAMANVSTARSLLNSGSSIQRSGWYFNPYFGYATFIPMNGMLRNPWGYNYYSPSRVYRYYSNYASNVGYGGGQNRNTPATPNFGNGPTYNSSLGYNVDTRASMSSSSNINTSSQSVSAPAMSAPAASRSDAAGASSGGAVSRGGGATGAR